MRRRPALGISTSRLRHRHDSSPRNIHVVAAAVPRLVSTEYPSRGRGVAATRPGRRRRESRRSRLWLRAKPNAVHPRWRAFAPNFEELHENTRYEEREDEFDIVEAAPAASAPQGLPDRVDVLGVGGVGGRKRSADEACGVRDGVR